MTAIYFAGPDIFLSHYGQHLALIKKLCAQKGFIALVPGDPELSGDGPPPDSAEIFGQNLHLIERADLLIANLAPFRGPVEPDSGTVFECGYGYARGKKIIGLVPDGRDLATKLGAAQRPRCPGGRFLADGSWVEDYGHPVNLMLAECFSAVAGTLEEAIDLVGDL